MEPTVELCAICAWRVTCQKKFSISGRDMRCADFSRDLSIGKEEQKPEQAKRESKEKGGKE